MLNDIDVLGASTYCASDVEKKRSSDKNSCKAYCEYDNNYLKPICDCQDPSMCFCFGNLIRSHFKATKVLHHGVQLTARQMTRLNTPNSVSAKLAQKCLSMRTAALIDKPYYRDPATGMLKPYDDNKCQIFCRL